ncbi:MAG: hypothetical protein ACI92B_001841 [Marinobacter maritimus]|jgi:hypothetical protein
MLFFGRVLAGAVLVILPLSFVSAEVFKWVDEAGNVHFGDSLPEKYRQTGKTLDVPVHEPSVADRQKAEAVAESIRQAAELARERRLEEDERLEGDSEKTDQKMASNSVADQAPPNQLQPGQARLTRKQRMENYEAEMARYRESQRCFAPYQMKGGGTRGYAFNKCQSVERPIHPDLR